MSQFLHDRHGRRFWWGLLAVLALSVLTRADFGTTPIDGDELYTLEFSEAPLRDNITSLLDDGAHPPVHNLLAAASIRLLGPTPWAVRVLSLLAGLATVTLVVAWIFRLTGSMLPALVAGILLALSPEAVHHSGWGRSYALYAVLVLLMAMALHRATRPLADGEFDVDRAAAWRLFGATAFLAVMTHYIAALYLFASGLALLAMSERSRLVRRWARYATPALVSLGLWLVAVRLTAQALGQGVATSVDWRGGPGLFDLVELVAKFNGLPALPKGTSVSLAALLIAGAWIAWRLRQAQEDRPWWPAIIALTMAAVPPAILFVAASPPVTAPVWSHRHLYPSHALMVVALTLGLWWAARGGWRTFLVGAVPLGGLVLAALLTEPVHRKVPYDAMANRIQELAAERASATGQPTTTIATSDAMLLRPVRFYLDGNVDVQSWESGARPAPDKDLLLLYRPESEHEVAIRDSLAAAGWQASIEEQYGDIAKAGLVRLTPPPSP